jgi:methylenetetrahydrofolate reductase (NADPH)
MALSQNGSSASGQLAERLRLGGLIVVAEVYPPNGVDIHGLLDRYAPLHHILDAVNISDSPMAAPLMSGLATAAMFERTGMPTILNMTCRDRNSIALQSDLLGAGALGIQSVFCVSGDEPRRGDHPHASPVYELDSLQLVKLARQLRSEGTLQSGRPLDSRPDFLIGAAGSLFKDPLQNQVQQTAAKVAAGADFLQTPAIFNPPLLHEFVSRLRHDGTLEQARLIAGVAIVTTLEQALWLQAERPEVMIPDGFVQNLQRTPQQERRALGLAYAADLINQICEIYGVNGILLYPYESREEDVTAIGELLEMVGFT